MRLGYRQQRNRCAHVPYWHDTAGICRGEMLALERDCALIKSEPNEHGVWGVLDIKRGLKRQARARKVGIDGEMKEVLERLMRLSQCQYVITDKDPKNGRASRPNPYRLGF